MRAAALSADSTPSIRPSDPGTVRTPARAAISRAIALSPIARIVSGVGPTKISPAASTFSAKFGVLREEAVAGVDRVGAARNRSRDDGVFVQIGFCRVRGTDLDRFIGEPGGQHILVRGARGLNRLDPKRLRRADDPNGDLAPIGDEELFNRHGRQTSRS